MVTVFFPKDAVIKVDAAGDVSLSNSTVLDTAFASATAMQQQFKDISITMQPGDANAINLLGTTSSFQNQEMEETPPDLVEVSGTIVHEGDELISGEIFGTGTAAGGTHTTYRVGQASKTKLAVLLNHDDGTDEVNYAITNAILTQWDPSEGSADGHFEVSVTFKCLAKDAFGPQFKD